MLRWVPTSVFNVPAMETWLQDQARRGRHFTGFLGDYLAAFERGEPREDVYRLEVADGAYYPEEEHAAMLDAAGWENVSNSPRVDFWVLRATRPDPAPIHTDPEVQAIGYRRLKRRLRRRTALYLLGMLVVIALAAVWLWMLSPRRLVENPYLLLMNNLPMFAALWLFYSALAVSDLLALRRLLKPLGAGVPMEHQGRVRRLRLWGLRALLLFIVLNFVLVFSLEGPEVFLRWQGPLADCPEPLPYVSVASLGAVSRAPDPSAEAWRSSLASAVYTVCDGDVTRREGSERWYQGHTAFYRASVPGLAGPLARELLREELPQGAERLGDRRFDGAWYALDGGGVQHLLLRRGRCVLWMRAEVPADLRDRLDAFAALLNAFS